MISELTGLTIYIKPFSFKRAKKYINIMLGKRLTLLTCGTVGESHSGFVKREIQKVLRDFRADGIYKFLLHKRHSALCGGKRIKDRV